MKSKIKLLVIFSLLFLVQLSCTIEKRHYMKGYHINRKNNVSVSSRRNIEKSSQVASMDKTKPTPIKTQNNSYNDEKVFCIDNGKSIKQENANTNQKASPDTFDKSSLTNNLDNNLVSKVVSKKKTNKQNNLKLSSATTKIKSENDNIVWQIIFLALTLFGVIKMAFEIGKKPYTELTIDEIRAKRKFKELPEESTDEESEAAWNLMSTSTQSWQTYTDENGDEFIRPYKKKHLKETAAILESVQAMLPTDPLVLERLNEVGYFTNSMAKRKFSGSIPLILVACASLILLTLIIGGPFFPALFSSWWLIASIVFYIFASRAPQYLINKRLDYYSGRNITSSFIAGFLSIFTSTPSTETVEYTYTSGRKETVEELNWGKVFIFVIMATVFLFMGMAIHVFGLLNFLRNYVFYF